MDTTSQPLQKSLMQRTSGWLPILALIVLVILLWLPFGWQVGFYTDEWTTMNDIQNGATITQSIRPFEVLSWFVAYHMSPDNLYIGINVLVMLLIIGKGIISYLLLLDLEFNKLFAFGTAVLIVLYPADEGVFYLGALSIHVSIFTFLLAAWLLVRFWLSRQWWLWIPIVLVTGLCVGIYEGIYPLIVLVPFLLVYLQRGISRRVIVTSLLWFITPLIFALRLANILFISNSSMTYQSSLFASDHSFGAILGSIWRVLGYSLVDSWYTNFQQTFAYTGWTGWLNVLRLKWGNPFIVYAIAVGAIVILICVMVISLSKQSTTPKKYFFAILPVSLVMFVCGFLLYSLTYLRDINTRTLLHASLGAALFISTLLWLISGLLKKPMIIYGIGLSIFAMMATTGLLLEHREHMLRAKAQIPFLQNVVRSAPQIAPGSMLVFLDETPDRELVKLFRISFYLYAPIRIIYSNASLSAVICYLNDTQPTGPYEEMCRFHDDQFQLDTNAVVLQSAYDHLVVFRYRADKTLQIETDIGQYTHSEKALSLYHPDRIINPKAELPIRARTMLDMS